jgi:transposase
LPCALRQQQAQRDLRMVKVAAEDFRLCRTPGGASAFLTVHSYLSTARKHGMNALAALRRLFQGHRWPPAPVEP